MKMKKYISIMVLVLGFISCEEYLDKMPDQGYTEEIVFNNFQSARGYFDQVFETLDDYLAHQSQNTPRTFLLGEMSDEGVNIYSDRTNVRFLNGGAWLDLAGKDISEVGWADNRVNTNTGNIIPRCFWGIRICNRVLEKVPEMLNLTQDQKDQLVGQAYFFRGWLYFELIRRVGGFPLLNKLFNSDDDGNMERLTYAQSNEYIIADMNEAIKLLPHKWEDLQTGRPTKSSAYAVKSMAQLYAASPLMRNGLTEIQQYTDYDPERVRLAAEYARDCLMYLEENKAVYNQTMMPKEEYANIFYHPITQYVSQESLWYKNHVGANREDPLTSLWQCYTMSGRRGTTGTPNFSPNQSMINKFETINGYPAELTADGWKSDDPAFDPDMPFKDRDPRLTHFIILPGESFGTRASKYGTAEDAQSFYLATWEGGNEFRLQGDNSGGRGDILTKYLVKKYQWPTSVTGRQGHSGYRDNSYNSILIRTTQVWLDYAEAMNEAYGPHEKPAGYTFSAVEALNLVRERVGHCPVRNEYTATKELFRDRIRNERAVELFCENHRWFDIRRWMTAEEIFSDPYPIKGAHVQIKSGYAPYVPVPNAIGYFPPGTTADERRNAKYGKCFTYSLTNVVEGVHVFERKNYWYPIRRDEMNRFPALVQNPGW